MIFSDNVNYAILKFESRFNLSLFYDGLFYIKNIQEKMSLEYLIGNKTCSQNVGGYIISPDKTNCPIFVNYEKEEDISLTTQYEDKFISRQEFTWMSKNRRTLNSPDVRIVNYKNGLRIPLFIKKSNDEGKDFTIWVN